jgi:hypothetical protein
MDKVTSAYEHALQCVYWDISNRGIRVDTEKLKIARRNITAEIDRNLSIATNQWCCQVFVGRDNNPGTNGAVNLNATQGEYALLKKLKDLGYEVPKIAKKNEEGEYESNYSTGELALQKMLAANQFNYTGGDPAIKAVLKVRELGKLKSGYVNSRLLRRTDGAYYLSIYNVAGTVTGRRGSKKHTFGFGNNGQNFPEHSSTAKFFRECLIAREGNIFVFVDQVQAEDWPVSALAQNYVGLQELKAGVDRHTNLASAIFGIPLSARSIKEWKDSMERYLGKKTRHAHNYDMTAPRMSDEMAKEGYSIQTPACDLLLKKVDALEPNVKGVFHKYVQTAVSNTRILVTPLGRERQVLGVRAGEYNNQLFKECYAFIPQSVVGDNTGFSVLDLETNYNERYIVQEGHDSLIQDVPATIASISSCLARTSKAFDRNIRFHNGIEINIPIEAKLGFSLHEPIKLKDFSEQSIRSVLEKLIEERNAASAQSINIGCTP